MPCSAQSGTEVTRAMSDAFKCDRCNEYHDGRGIYLHAGERLYDPPELFPQYEFTHKSDVCKSCFSAFVDCVDTFLEGGDAGE